MIFESINYAFLLQDFVFAMAAGFVVGFLNQIVSIFICKGRICLFIKDIFICTVFAVTLFSYVVSFANYPVVRFYHIICAFAGFLSFNIRFSTIFHKIFEKIYKIFLRKILWLWNKIKTAFCVRRHKMAEKRQKTEDLPKNADLKTREVLIYN